MTKNYELLRALTSDLGLNAPILKGQAVPVRNCWHFSTNGTLVDFMFRDEEDFEAGMNRIFVLRKRHKVIILAFVLMDTHVHFILWGELRECEMFVHEFIKLTSRHIAHKYGERHKFEHLLPDYQTIGDDRYLKTAICYVLKNPPVGGLAYNALEYPWSSASLYFRKHGYWTSPGWESLMKSSEEFSVRNLRDILRCRNVPRKAFRLIGNIVFPGEYVAAELVEKLFRTHRAFNFFMCISKETDIESVQGSISRLTIPNAELGQHKTELCRSRFGVDTIRKLSTKQRLVLARELKATYNCSPKQIAKACGLIYAEVKEML